MKVTYFVSQSKDAGYTYEVTAINDNMPERSIVKRWPCKPDGNEHIQEREAIGIGVMLALQSKNDFGNKAEVVIELPICSIDSPVIKL
jgi:hypothetical protein